MAGTHFQTISEPAQQSLGSTENTIFSKLTWSNIYGLFLDTNSLNNFRITQAAVCFVYIYIYI